MKTFTCHHVMIVLAPLLLLACGGEAQEIPEPGPGDGSISGSRLRARLYRTEGAAQFRDWWDSELGTPCTFQMAADREWRCLPVGGGYGAYADGQCAREVLLFSPETPPLVTEGASFDETTECWGRDEGVRRRRREAGEGLRARKRGDRLTPHPRRVPPARPRRASLPERAGGQVDQTPMSEWDLARLTMYGPEAAPDLLDDRYLAISYHADGAS